MGKHTKKLLALLMAFAIAPGLIGTAAATIGSKVINVTYRDINITLNEDKQANFETLWKIANALDMRPSELVTLIENKIEQND